jgi:hypothetical protein
MTPSFIELNYLLRASYFFLPPHRYHRGAITSLITPSLIHYYVRMNATAFRSALTGLWSGTFQGATGVGGSIIMVAALSSKWGLKLPQVQSRPVQYYYCIYIYICRMVIAMVVFECLECLMCVVWCSVVWCCKSRIMRLIHHCNMAVP